MEFFRDTKIDFMGKRRAFVLLSAILLVIGIFGIFVHGRLNIGIDFAGGTQLTLRFLEEPQVDELRGLLSDAEIDDAQIQRFGEAGANEVLIKTPTVEDSDEGSREIVVAALDERFNSARQHNFDLNRRGSAAITDLLIGLDPDGRRVGAEDEGREYYAVVAKALVAAREEDGLLTDWGEVAAASGVTASVTDALRANADLGYFSVLGSGNVGPQIGSELRTKGILAVVSSLIGMLLYIWFRFELRFGIGALVAVTHDVLITLGLFAWAGLEFNLTTIAAFLTLVGYSVNDSVVVFDRVRENLRRSRSRPLVEVMNLSLNQTLSRTVLTSGTTLLAVVSLLVLGGDVLRGFAFILTAGVIVGTYSSIYVASPFALLWDRVFGSKDRSGSRRLSSS